MQFKISPAICFNLDYSKILSSGNRSSNISESLLIIYIFFLVLDSAENEIWKLYKCNFNKLYKYDEATSELQSFYSFLPVELKTSFQIFIPS